jgi:pimeloyl-ACP methyl ester carboxylesterase
MLHAHGGLVSTTSAIQYVANNYQTALAAEIYPVSFIWRSDAWTTIRYMLQEAFVRRRDEGILDAAKDFMLDRVDDTLEPLARVLGGKAMWDEMKENARLATLSSGGAARMAADSILRQYNEGRIDEIHLVGHSAGAIFHAHLAQYLVQNGALIASLTLWAPACTMELFKDVYRPLIESGAIRSFRLFTLDKDTEEDDDCAGIYHKSLLHLVSAAFEKRPRIPLIQKGISLLGLARDVKREIEAGFWTQGSRKWIVAPGAAESDARHHGDFDNDKTTLDATLAMIGGRKGLSGSTMRVRAAAPRALVRRRQRLEHALAVPASMAAG